MPVIPQKSLQLYDDLEQGEKLQDDAFKASQLNL